MEIWQRMAVYLNHTLTNQHTLSGLPDTVAPSIPEGRLRKKDCLLQKTCIHLLYSPTIAEQANGIQERNFNRILIFAGRNFN